MGALLGFIWKVLVGNFIAKIVIGTIVGVLTAAAVAAIGLAITDQTGVTEVRSVFQGDFLPKDLIVCRRSAIMGHI